MDELEHAKKKNKKVVKMSKFWDDPVVKIHNFFFFK